MSKLFNLYFLSKEKRFLYVYGVFIIGGFMSFYCPLFYHLRSGPDFLVLIKWMFIFCEGGGINLNAFVSGDGWGQGFLSGIIFSSNLWLKWLKTCQILLLYSIDTYTWDLMDPWVSRSHLTYIHNSCYSSFYTLTCMNVNF